MTPWILRLIPARDRDAIVGDLLEEADYRGLSGARLRWWLLGEVLPIAGGLTLMRLRGWLVLPPVREVVSGLAIDGRAAGRSHTISVVLRALIFCGSLATMMLGVEVLVRTLLSAAGL